MGIVGAAENHIFCGSIIRQPVQQRIITQRHAEYVLMAIERFPAPVYDALINQVHDAVIH